MKTGAVVPLYKGANGLNYSDSPCINAQSLDASQAGRVYFIPAYLCAGLPGPIGTELYLEELKEQLLPAQSALTLD